MKHNSCKHAWNCTVQIICPFQTHSTYLVLWLMTTFVVLWNMHKILIILAKNVVQTCRYILWLNLTCQAFHVLAFSPLSAEMFTVKLLQPGPPEDFQPIGNRSLNKELNMQTSQETNIFLDWLLLILKFRRLKWFSLSVSQSEIKES